MSCYQFIAGALLITGLTYAACGPSNIKPRECEQQKRRLEECNRMHHKRTGWYFFKPTLNLSCTDTDLILDACVRSLPHVNSY